MGGKPWTFLSIVACILKPTVNHSRKHKLETWKKLTFFLVCFVITDVD
jgi:hypothetical protein